MLKECRRADPALRKILPPQAVRRDGAYVRSQFALPFEHEGRRLWFHTLTRQLAEPEGRLPERVTAEEAAGNGELEELIRAYYLVPEGKDECAFYMGVFRIMHAMVRRKGIAGYTILPTTACNARCVYCFEEGRPQTTMTQETAEKTAEYIIRTRRPGEIVLNWFGGEPLAAPAVIDFITERVREAGIPFQGNITTNGSLITEKTADRMAGPWQIRHAQVSMDGDEADYAARKRYPAGKGHYRRVLSAVRMLAERGVKVSVRSNVDEENIGGVGAFLSDLAEAVPDKSNVDVYLSGLNAVRESGGSPALWRKIAESRPLIRSFGFRARDSRFTLYDFRNRHCMADMGSVVIGPDGSLYACEHCSEEMRYGNLTDGSADPEKEERIRGTDSVREKCRKCPFLPECTPFASCPVQDAGCREIRMLRFQIRTAEYLEGKAPAAEEEVPDADC